MERSIKQQIIITKPELIINYLKEKHLSQKQFAKICGVSHSTIEKIVSGNRRFCTKNLQKVLTVANIPLDEYFNVEFLFLSQNNFYKHFFAFLKQSTVSDLVCRNLKIEV